MIPEISSHMLQNQIHDIIVSKAENIVKLENLKSLLSDYDGIAYCDLDDTITTQRSMLYARLYLLLHFSREEKNMEYFAELLKKYIEINPKFLALCKNKSITKIIILSRNEFSFLEAILPFLRETLALHSIDLLWVVWGERMTWGSFRFTTENKREILPEKSLLIADMFEYPLLSKYSNFYSVDTKNSFLTRTLARINKYRILLPFACKLLLWKISYIR